MGCEIQAILPPYFTMKAVGDTFLSRGLHPLVAIAPIAGVLLLAFGDRIDGDPIIHFLSIFSTNGLTVS